ncbi:DUF4865 family protein [Dactylosporangium darangshiense]|uniref:DUF4865 family protein n=2 Tax=Dactylosporangium darangshiense TaxID=579108 RepID=A0ABP8DQR6_9ACTN
MYGMDAMQYELTLPTDYDMGTIRERVRRNGHALDERAGLGLKAYLIRTAGVDGSPVNQYAPFYLWNSAAAMTGFLIGGGGFQNIVRDFGRPPVRHWTAVATLAGPARDEAPVAATRLVAPLAWGEELPELAERPGLHTAAVAFDMYHWQLVRFALWSTPDPHDPGATERYEVLHVSAPEPLS